MKRNVCFKVLSVFLLFLVVWVPLLPVLNGTDASASQADYGDVNGDGEVTVRDAILVLKHVSGLLNLEEKYDNGAYERANVFTGTDFVGVGDAVFILRYVVGLQDELPTDSSDYEEGLGGDVYYEWGEESSYSFTVKVNVYNEGSDTANNVQVNLPMLENDSPYQDTNLIDTNYPNTSSSGRISTFNLDDLSPGQSKTLEVNYNIDVRPVSVNSDANGTIEDAQNIFDRYAGSGNCHELATQFVDHCQDEGIEARVVTGFARPHRGDMTSGCLSGCRHSWAEFYVDYLGWVPVDLTFEYFAEFPYASHLVETYSAYDPITINASGGDLGATWQNKVD